MRRALTVIASCLAIAACGGDSTAPPVATSLEIVAAGTQTAPAGKLVPQTPTFVVKDQGGNPMAGAPVTIVVAAGGGTLTGAPTQSAAGPTQIGQWTLGQSVALNRVTVAVGGLPSLTITAEGVAGPIAKVSPIGTTAFTGRIGGTLEPGPRALVADEFDNPIAGVTVAIETGGGSTAPVTTMVTDANGAIMVPKWVLGSTQGQYTLTVSVGSFSTVFTATATSGPPASINVLEGGSQAAPAATPLSAPLRLKVEDAFGNAVDNELVQFELVAGGGSLESTSAQTNNAGVVTVPPWTMGRTDVPQTIRAVAGTVTQEVTLSVATQFKIDLRFPAGMTPDREAIFLRAAQRIQGIVMGDLPDLSNASLEMTNAICGSQPCACGFPGETYTGFLDDIVIYAAIVAIDGPGNVLGSAGPCYIRGPGLGFPLTGVMLFDEADVANLEAGGRLQDVILHEMLHVLGIGTYWGPRGLLQGANTLDVRYTGPLGREGCVQAGGASVCSLTVPVHSCAPTAEGQFCQLGTVNSHWRETTFGNELMTGFVSSGANPLSAMTIGSLEDLGYNVNRAPRDDYNIPSAGFQGNVIPGTGTAQPWELLVRPVGTVDPSGRVTKLPQPQ
ncbi:MAG TPA: leishmanolysin-related zinc metalloendopeptidase [Gemmatimonadaceae bacterium]